MWIKSVHKSFLGYIHHGNDGSVYFVVTNNSYLQSQILYDSLVLLTFSTGVNYQTIFICIAKCRYYLLIPWIRGFKVYRMLNALIRARVRKRFHNPL